MAQCDGNAAKVETSDNAVKLTLADGTELQFCREHAGALAMSIIHGLLNTGSDYATELGALLRHAVAAKAAAESEGGVMQDTRPEAQH